MRARLVFAVAWLSASTVIASVGVALGADGDAVMDYPEDEFDQEDGAFASFFDNVIIPAKQQRLTLDPRIGVSKLNATQVRECAGAHRRLLDADHRVIIIGGGPAGLSAAVYAARAEMAPLVVARDGGQLESTSMIDNYPGFEEGVDAVELIQRLVAQAKRFGASFKECDITGVDIGCRPFRVECRGGQVTTSSALIIATGASAKWLGVHGEQELLSKGVHTCATCDGFFYKGRHAAVVGGGDTAMEQALFLARMASKVTVVHRRGEFRASKAMATRVLNHPTIEILWNTEVAGFVGIAAAKGGGEERLVALRLFGENPDKNNKGGGGGSAGSDELDPSSSEWLLPVDGCFVAIGHVPNTQLFDDDPSLRRDADG